MQAQAMLASQLSAAQSRTAFRAPQIGSCSVIRGVRRAMRLPRFASWMCGSPSRHVGLFATLIRNMNVLMIN